MSHHLPHHPPTGAPAPWTPAGRAPRGVRVLADPGMQRDLRRLVRRVQGLLAGRAVLEVGCADGWWTAQIAQAAQAVTGVEAGGAAPLLREASVRRYPPGRVRLMEVDSDRLDRVPGQFDGGFAAFPGDAPDSPALGALLVRLHGRLCFGAKVVIVDEIDGTAAPGAQEAALRARVRAVAPDARALRLDSCDHLWCLSYTL